MAGVQAVDLHYLYVMTQARDFVRYGPHRGIRLFVADMAVISISPEAYQPTGPVVEHYFGCAGDDFVETGFKICLRYAQVRLLSDTIEPQPA